MADNAFSVRVPSIYEALLAGEQGYKDARGMATEREQDAARKEAQRLYASGDTRSALARLIGANDPKLVTALGQYETGANSVYGTPIYGTGEGGETRIGTFDKRGQFRPIDTPGFTPTPGIKTVDTGTGTMVIDQRTGRPVQSAAQPTQGFGGMPRGGPQPQGGFIPKDIAGEAALKTQGTEQGKASFSLPATLAKADQGIKIIDDLIAHPGRETATGVSGMIDPRNYIPATNATNFKIALKQLEGQTFLQAFESLKGGGAITEIEGQKATQAIARLDRAQSDAEFKRALKDLKDVLVAGKARAQQMGQMPTPPQGLPNAPVAPAPNAPVSKNIGGRTYIQINGQWFEQ